MTRRFCALEVDKVDTVTVWENRQTRRIARANDRVTDNVKEPSAIDSHDRKAKQAKSYFGSVLREGPGRISANVRDGRKQWLTLDR